MRRLFGFLGRKLPFKKPQMPPRLQRKHLALAVLTLMVSVLFVADLAFGSIPIPFSAVWAGLTGGIPRHPEWMAIITEIRLPKALTAILAGASLATGGLLTQSLFRNPLTGPDAIGLTSGAGLGVALAVLAGAGNSMGLTLAMAASAGAAGSFFIISLIGSRVGGGTLLVAGLMQGAFTSAIVSALQFFSDARDLQRYTLWTLGSIGGTGQGEVMVMTLTLITGLIVAWASVKGLNGFALGNSYAESIGINTKALKISILVSSSLLTGAVTAFCGPVTFVGIAAPHLIRRIADTNDHLYLIPMSALTGSLLVLACDLITQLPGSGQVLPLNSVTALLGAPVVIWVLMRTKSAFFK